MSTRLAPWPLFGSGGARRADEQGPSRPDLKLVEGGNAPRLERLTPKSRLIALMAMVAVVLFAVVAFHVVLSQGQFKLDRLQTKTATEQDNYERLRLQVAQLESPARITSEAQNRLGMVAPDKVTPVTPNPDDLAPGTVGTAGASTAGGEGLENWSKVKPYLSSSSK